MTPEEIKHQIYLGVKEVEKQLVEILSTLESWEEEKTKVAKHSPDEVLTAIKDSMYKWWSIIMCAEKDEGSRDCALCQLFLKNGCRGCPISEKTKKGGCNGTPYPDWVDHHNEAHPGVETKVLCPECASIAADMYKFLDKLRKDYETPRESCD